MDASAQAMPPPAVPSDVVRDLCARRYGLRVGAMRTMPTERDQVLQLTEADSGVSFLLRISPESEARATLELQNAALRSLARQHPDLPVPRVVASCDGCDIETLELGSGEHHVRVLTYLAGEPVGRTRGSPAQRAGLGVALAQLDGALAQCEHSADGDSHLWNVLKAPQLRQIAHDVGDEAVRALVIGALDAFARDALPVLERLPVQFIHNDFNPKNVLVDPADPARVTGIIDFGDMMRAPRIVDLGVAIARQITPADPVGEGLQMFVHYQRTFPLVEAEIDVLPACVCVRLAMRIAIWEWRRRTGRRLPTQDVVAGAVALLGALKSIVPAELTAAFHRASIGAGLST